MKEMGGYIDITARDFQAIYRLAHRLALKRLMGAVRAGDLMTREVVFVARTTPQAVATGIAAIYLTKTLHPPGGATALIAVIGGDKIHHLCFFYALMPVGLGAVVMLVALLVNNIPRGRKYPEFWL